MNNRNVRLSLVAFAALAATSHLTAQRQVAVFYGVTTGGAFGRAIVPAPDRNGDGPDLLVGIPEWTNGAGRAVWVNGQTGQVIGAANGTGITTRLGSSITPAGDLNGDGFADVAVGSPSASTYAGITSIIFGSANQTDVSLLSPGAHPSESLTQALGSSCASRWSRRPQSSENMRKYRNFCSSRKFRC